MKLNAQKNAENKLQENCITFSSLTCNYPEKQYEIKNFK